MLNIILIALVLVFAANKTFGQSLTEKDLVNAFDLFKLLYENKTQNCSVVNDHKGDLNGDGKIDVVIKYTCSHPMGGNAITGGGLLVYLNDNGKPEMRVHSEGNQMSVKNIINGIIYGEIWTYAPNDPRCCPSIKTPKKMRVDGFKLVEVH